MASSELVAPGDTIELTATATDPDPGDMLTYTWSATAGTFPGGASGAVATWLAPATDQPLSVTLTVRVRDKVGASAAASFAVSVTPANGKGSASVVASFNDAPSVSAIAMDQNPLTVGTDAHLGVTATDLDGDAIASYLWTTTCLGTFSDAASATPTFIPSAVPPGGATSCAFTVKVTDTRSGWNTGTLSVATGAGATVVTPPLVDTTFQSADAANGAGTVSLRIAAHDPAPNGGVTYAWTPTSGTIDNPTASDVTWTAPACMSGDVRVSVTITSTATHQSTTQVFTITPGTTTGCATTSTCVFDQSSFDDGCVFAP